MTNDTKLSDLTVGEFKALMRECLQQDMDAAKEVERLRAAFSIDIDRIDSDYNRAIIDTLNASRNPSMTGKMIKVNTPE